MRNSRASLFLMEIMISVLFFSISSAVCIQLFVKAHTINIHTENLAKATIIAQNLSEYYLNGDTTLDSSLREQMLNHLSDYHTVENHIIIYYNDKWSICQKDDAAYLTALTFHEDADFSYLAIDITTIDKSETIYSSSVKKHIKGRALI